MSPRKTKTNRPVTRGQKSFASEHRRSHRVATKLLTMFRQHKEHGRAVSFVRTLNLSEKGALIESADALQVGQRVWVEILLDFNRVVNLESKVVYLTLQPNGFVFAGIEFKKLKTTERRMLIEQIEAEK